MKSIRIAVLASFGLLGLFSSGVAHADYLICGSCQNRLEGYVRICHDYIGEEGREDYAGSFPRFCKTNDALQDVAIIEY
jgi:threonine dehydrogenase-like Zn-dependent dehydrogenase